MWEILQPMLHLHSHADQNITPTRQEMRPASTRTCGVGGWEIGHCDDRRQSVALRLAVVLVRKVSFPSRALASATILRMFFRVETRPLPPLLPFLLICTPLCTNKLAKELETR
jgi:hypothetical protein